MQAANSNEESEFIPQRHGVPLAYCKLQGKAETPLLNPSMLKHTGNVNRHKTKEENIHAINNLVKMGYRVAEICPFQFRVNGIVDIYPVNSKYHHIPLRRRGEFDTVEELISEFFSTSTEL